MNHITVTCSVRELVEFVLRSGDINSRYLSAKRMQEGAMIHQKLQKQRKKQAKDENFVFDSEVKLSYEKTCQELIFLVEGRADCIMKKDNTFIVEELKSTYTPLDELLENDQHWHFAQAKCYALFLAKQHNLSSVLVWVTYCHVEQVNIDKVKTFEQMFTLQELEAFFDDLLNVYYKWAQRDMLRKIERNKSIQNSGFVYPEYRKGQREFAVLCYRAIQNNRNLFVEAPTGTGKTVSALFPAIKALGEGLLTNVFYVTAKTITRQVAENAIFMMKKSGYLLTYVTLTAKDKICPLPVRNCNPKECEFAKGHFDRVNDAVWDILNKETCFDRNTIARYANLYKVCPYELSLDISLWVDVIIGDYNYAFDPKSSLKRFFGESPRGKYVLLIDEAHNLLERAQEMFSARLLKSQLTAMKKYMRTIHKPLYKALHAIIKEIDKLFLECQESAGFNDANEQVSYANKAMAKEEPPTTLYPLLEIFVERADVWLSEQEGSEMQTEIMEVYFTALDFLRVRDYFDQGYRFFMEQYKGEIVVRLLCLDPSFLLSEILQKAVSGIFFSATFTPLSYFKQVLGGQEEDAAARLPSPFAKENICVIVEKRISTKYRNREKSYQQIADAIVQMVSAKKGNYLVFFSSYLFMEAVYSLFGEKNNEIEMIKQEKKMDEEDREAFLSLFSEKRSHSFIAFAVMGGIFSEGIDLVGEKLIGVAVVGVGLPLLCHERNLLSGYYQQKKQSGYSFAYLFPGMNKVLQAAGRLIRTEGDKGIVLLIDERFATREYTDLFPNNWFPHQYVEGKEGVLLACQEFWKKTNGLTM